MSDYQTNQHLQQIVSYQRQQANALKEIAEALRQLIDIQARRP